MSTLTLPRPLAARVTAGRLLATAATVGVLDGLFAVVLWVVVIRRATPPQVFQGVASALLGPAAFQGGRATAALGLALHFGVALAWTLVYALAYRGLPRLRALTARPGGTLAVAGAFGPLVWLTMQLVVVPLTLARPTPVLSGRFLANLLGHVVVVALPIVLGIRTRDE